jgi:hypothetical protein
MRRRVKPPLDCPGNPGFSSSLCFSFSLFLTRYKWVFPVGEFDLQYLGVLRLSLR